MKRWIVAVMCVVLGASALALVGSTPRASAAGCPDVEVVFARGTVETAPPVGITGLAFTEALRSQLPGKSVRVYGVNYPASSDFGNRLKFAHTVLNGVKDAQRRVIYLANACPRTRIVLGGYSQGAALVSYAAHGGLTIPASYQRYARYAPPELPAKAASRIAAIVMFGTPSDRFLRDVGVPPLSIGNGFRSRTARYCIPGDNICNGSPVAGPNVWHVLYPVNGMTFDAARYTVRHL